MDKRSDQKVALRERQARRFRLHAAPWHADERRPYEKSFTVSLARNKNGGLAAAVAK